MESTIPDWVNPASAIMVIVAAFFFGFARVFVKVFELTDPLYTEEYEGREEEIHAVDTNPRAMPRTLGWLTWIVIHCTPVLSGDRENDERKAGYYHWLFSGIGAATLLAITAMRLWVGAPLPLLG